jgi:hypothetical protein
MNLFTRVTLCSFCYHFVASLTWMLGFLAGMQNFNSSAYSGLGSVLFFLHTSLMLPAAVVDFFIQSSSESFMAYLSRGALGPFPSFLTIATSIAAGALFVKLKGSQKS